MICEDAFQQLHVFLNAKSTGCCSQENKENWKCDKNPKSANPKKPNGGHFQYADTVLQHQHKSNHGCNNQKMWTCGYCYRDKSKTLYLTAEGFWYHFEKVHNKDVYRKYRVFLDPEGAKAHGQAKKYDLKCKSMLC